MPDINICRDIFIVACDCYGNLWLWDSVEKRIFVEGDTTERIYRGYDCPSLSEAKRMVFNNEVP
jgi:hypothetical protein